MKPTGILFDSYMHFRTWQRHQINIRIINILNMEWELYGDENHYLAIIPNTSSLEEDSFDRWNKYQGVEFADILSPSYSNLDYIPSWLKLRIR